jgi:hypothetical protein
MPFRRRRHRRWIALIALAALLFQQLAMAAYVCPIDQKSSTSATASDLPPCHSQGAKDAVRCHEHCYPQPPSSDHAPTPTVPAAVLPATTWWRAAAWQPVAIGTDVPRDILARATDPPLTVQHCTFQI